MFRLPLLTPALLLLLLLTLVPGPAVAQTCPFGCPSFPGGGTGWTYSVPAPQSYVLPSPQGYSVPSPQGYGSCYSSSFGAGGTYGYAIQAPSSLAYALPARPSRVIYSTPAYVPSIGRDELEISSERQGFGLLGRPRSRSFSLRRVRPRAGTRVTPAPGRFASGGFPCPGGACYVVR